MSKYIIFPTDTKSDHDTENDDDDDERICFSQVKQDFKVKETTPR